MSDNIFVSKVKRAFAKRNITISQIQEFSDRMQQAMGLDVDLLQDALMNKVSWDISEYTIYPTSHPWNSWKAMLEVVPSDIYKAYGDAPRRAPDGWHFRMFGTLTEILPPVDIQDKIIDLINQEKEKQC